MDVEGGRGPFGLHLVRGLEGVGMEGNNELDDASGLAEEDALEIALFWPSFSRLTGRRMMK